MYSEQHEWGVLTDSIERGMKRHKVTGMAIGLVDEGRLVYAQGFGYADKKNSRLVDTTTLFKLGSISKLFTGSAIMQLYEVGKIDLDAPIQEIIPELNISTHSLSNIPVSIRSIMSHTSGLISDVFQGMFNRHPESFHKAIEYLNNVHAAYEPGTISTYSNIGTDLLGIVIERISGLSYADYIKINLFDSLAMTASTMDCNQVKQTQMSLAYMRNKENEEYGLRSQPAGNLYSNVLDVGNFIAMAMNKGAPIMSSDSFAEMTRDQTTQTLFKSGNKFGLNWIVSRPELAYLGPVIWHNGGTINFMSSLVVLPESGLGVVVLSNSAHSMPLVEKVTDDVLKAAATLKLGKAPPSKQVKSDKNVPGNCVTTRDVEGHYATLSGAVRIKRKGKRLYVKLIGTPLHLKLLPANDGWFSLRACLFGFIPLPIKRLKSIRMQIREMQGITIIQGMDNQADFLFGSKFTPVPLTRKWRELLGHYEVQYPTDDFHCFKKVKLFEKNGVLLLRLKFNDMGSLNIPLEILDTVNEKGQAMALTIGLGRGMHETLYVDQNDSALIFSGYRLIRQK